MSATALTLGLVLATVPMTRFDHGLPGFPIIKVWPSIPRGARIRMEVSVNCKGKLSTNYAKNLVVLRGKTEAKGLWVVERNILAMSGSRMRMKFMPRRPLQPGTYTVASVSRVRRGKVTTRAISRHGKVVVSSRADKTPPKFGGLAGIGCKPLIQYVRRCVSPGILFRHGRAKDASAVRYVLYVRRKGKPFDSTKPVETDGIRSAINSPPLWPAYLWGNFIITLRARDAADNEGGRVCEVQIEIPVDSNCVSRRWRTGRRWRVGRERLRFIRARCARWDKRKRQWISAIDGVALGLSGP